MGTWAVKVSALPGVPAPSVLAELADVMVGPFLALDPVVDEGPALTTETGLKPLVEHLATRPNFSAVGRSNYESSFRWNKYFKPHSPVVSTGSVTTFVEASAVEAEVLLEALVASTQVLDAPFASLDLGGFAERDRVHVALFQEGKTGNDRIAGLGRGLSGVPWRTVLGPVLVDFFGVDVLRSLPSELAREVAEGFWLLTPCEQNDEWDAARWCSGEEQIIEALGRDRFFDPASGTLPTEYAPLPSIASIPVKAEQPTSRGEWEFHNGYPAE